MAQARLTPEQANFRKAYGPDKRRCGGYAPLLPCSMFLPDGSMLQGNCDTVAIPENTTDDEHTCQLWKERTEEDDNRDDAQGSYDGDSDDVPASLSARMGKGNLMRRAFGL